MDDVKSQNESICVNIVRLVWVNNFYSHIIKEIKVSLSVKNYLYKDRSVLRFRINLRIIVKLDNLPTKKVIVTFGKHYSSPYVTKIF